jgi:hypothetical protein
MLDCVVEFGSVEASSNLDVPVKWTTGSACPSSSPGGSIFVTLSSIMIKRIASVVSIGWRGVPGPGSEAKL